MTDASTHAPQPRGVSTTTLILGIALTATTTAAALLAVLYLTDRRPNAAAQSGPGAPAIDPAKPTMLTGTETPHLKPSGEVHYETPFAAPPRLTLKPAGKHTYSIVKQDEYGFSWAADSLVDDFTADIKDIAEAIRVGTATKKTDVQYEDFAWEAKGLPAPPGALPPQAAEQHGSFATVYDQAGEVNFETPFGQPPHVELSGSMADLTVVQECKPTGFRFKTGNNPQFPQFNHGSVDWTAKGIKATTAPK